MTSKTTLSVNGLIVWQIAFLSEYLTDVTFWQLKNVDGMKLLNFWISIFSSDEHPENADELAFAFSDSMRNTLRCLHDEKAFSPMSWTACLITSDSVELSENAKLHMFSTLLRSNTTVDWPDFENEY